MGNKNITALRKNNCNRSLTEYNSYKLSVREKLTYMTLSAFVVFAVGYIFYRSTAISLILCTISPLYLNTKKKEIIKRRKQSLNLQFKDMLYALSSSLSAGKSVELAFKDTVKDLAIIYPDKNTPIIKEAEYIIKRIEMNETLEAAISNFAHRAQLDDIQSFVDVFVICKRTGGNIIEIIQNTAHIINDKIEIRHEINTLLAQKKLEQKILSIMPIGIILLLSLSAGDYMEPIFNTLQGRAAMTVSALLLTVAHLISRRIMDIRI